MGDGIKFKIEGSRELEAALGEFTKSTERTLLRRVAIKALQPVIDTARDLVPVHEGKLRDSLVIGSKLTRRAKAAAKADPVDGVRVFAGSASRNAVPREFGSARSSPEPFMRPAWASRQMDVLSEVQTGLAASIEAARLRAEKRALKAKG